MHARHHECVPSTHLRAPRLSSVPPSPRPRPQICLSLPREQIGFVRSPTRKASEAASLPHSNHHHPLTPGKVAAGEGNSLADTLEQRAPLSTYLELQTCSLRAGCLCCNGRGLQLGVQVPDRGCRRRGGCSLPARPVTHWSLSSPGSTSGFALLCSSFGGIFGLEGGEPDPALDLIPPRQGGNGREVERMGGGGACGAGGASTQAGRGREGGRERAFPSRADWEAE